MSDGIIGYKAAIYRSPDAGVTWIKQPEVISISPADPQVDEAEFTHLESPSKRREFKSTFSDGGEVGYESNYIDKVVNAADAQKQSDVVGLRDAGTIQQWKIEWHQNDAVGALLATVQFPAYVKSARVGETTTTDPVRFAVSLRVTGAEAW